MGKIFLIFLKIIVSIVNFILVPINSLIVSNFPDISNMIYNFNNIINNYIGGGLSYFSSILPPMTRTCILFYLNVLIWGYGIVYSVHLIVKLFRIIKNVKFW